MSLNPKPPEEKKPNCSMEDPEILERMDKEAEELIDELIHQENPEAKKRDET